jgi:hypothetical protein
MRDKFTQFDRCKNKLGDLLYIELTLNIFIFFHLREYEKPFQVPASGKQQTLSHLEIFPVQSLDG